MSPKKTPCVSLQSPVHIAYCTQPHSSPTHHTPYNLCITRIYGVTIRLDLWLGFDLYKSGVKNIDSVMKLRVYGPLQKYTRLVLKKSDWKSTFLFCWLLWMCHSNRAQANLFFVTYVKCKILKKYTGLVLKNESQNSRSADMNVLLKQSAR